MPLKKIWNCSTGQFAEFELSAETQNAIESFIGENTDGDMFCAHEVNDLLTEEEQEALSDVDTCSLLIAFLPEEGDIGVTQHGHDDFAIESPNSGEDDEDEIGDYTLTLRFVDVPRSEVEHIAEDCCRSGDYPADSFEID